MLSIRRPRRAPASLIASALAATSLTLVTAAASPAHAAVPSQIQYTIFAGTQNRVHILNLPSGTGDHIDHAKYSLGSLALNSTGSVGYVDKAQYRQPGGGTDLDARVFPLDGNHQTIGDSEIVAGCNGPTALTMSPDDLHLAMYCKGEKKLLIVDPGTLAEQKSIAFDNQTTDIAWAKDSSAVFFTTGFGIYAYHYAPGTLEVMDNVDSRNYTEVRVMPDGRAISLAIESDFAAHIEYFTCAVTCTRTETTVISDGAFGSVFTLNPSGTALWLTYAGGSVRKIDLATGTPGQTLSPSIPGEAVRHLSMDPSGRYVIVVAGNAETKQTIQLIDTTTSSSAATDTLDTSEPGAHNDLVGRPFVTKTAPPTANFSATGGLTGQSVPFYGQASTALGTSPVSYTWHWDDGAAPDTTTSSSQTAHIFTTGGSHAVTLTVTDDLGQGGPGTGSWDGNHWFDQGGPSAVVTHPVYTSTTSFMTLSADGYDANGAQTIHVPFGTTPNLTVHLKPELAGYSPSTPVHWFLDGIELTGATSTSSSPTGAADDPGSASWIAIEQGVKLGAPGVHKLLATYDGNQGSGGAVGPAQSNEVDIIVDSVASNVSASSPSPEIATGDSVPVNAVLGGACGSGKYTVIIDGDEVANDVVATPAQNTDSIPVNGVADGVHSVRVRWEPAPTDQQCVESVSTPFSVKVGTSATTTVLSGPAEARPGAVTLHTTVTETDIPSHVPPSGNVTIKEGTTTLVTVPLGAGGLNTIPVELDAQGSHSLTASFSHSGPGWGPSTSSPLSVLIDDNPKAPLITSLTAGNGSLTVACSPPTDTGNQPITGYVFVATPLDAVNGKPTTVNGPACPFAITGLTNGEAYNVTVAAVNKIGTGPASAPVEGIAGLAKGVSLLLSANPVPVGSTLQFYGYASDHSAPLANHAVKLYQRLTKTKLLATVQTDKFGRFRYNLKITHTGAVRATTLIGKQLSYSKELLAKIAFVLRNLKATISHGHVVITGAITPGSPSAHEHPDRVAVYRSDATGKKLGYIGDAKLTKTKPGASATTFRYDHSATVLGTSGYVYVNPLGTTVNTSTHKTVHVSGRPA